MAEEFYSSAGAIAYHVGVTAVFGLLLAGYLAYGRVKEPEFTYVYLLVIFTMLLLLPIVKEITILGFKFKRDMIEDSK